MSLAVSYDQPEVEGFRTNISSFSGSRRVQRITTVLAGRYALNMHVDMLGLRPGLTLSSALCIFQGLRARSWIEYSLLKKSVSSYTFPSAIHSLC